MNEEETKEMGLVTKQAQVSMFLNEQRFEFAQRIGKMLAASTMLPDHFRNNIGNCLIALNLSERLGIDVFGLMQTCYIVHGRPGFEAKLLIAIFNARTQLFVPPLRWEMKGSFPKGGDAACRAYAVDKETQEPLYGEWIDWQMVNDEGWNKKQGSKWLTMPGQMFRYRSASFFINAYEPGLKMGIQTIDELEEIIDIMPVKPASEKVADLQRKINEASKNGEPSGLKPPQKEDLDPKPDPPPPKVNIPETEEETKDDELMADFKLLKGSKSHFKKSVMKNLEKVRKMKDWQQDELRKKWYNFAGQSKGGLIPGDMWPLLDDKPLHEEPDSTEEPQKEKKDPLLPLDDEKTQESQNGPPDLSMFGNRGVFCNRDQKGRSVDVCEGVGGPECEQVAVCRDYEGWAKGGQEKQKDVQAYVLCPETEFSEKLTKPRCDQNCPLPDFPCPEYKKAWM